MRCSVCSVVSCFLSETVPYTTLQQQSVRMEGANSGSRLNQLCSSSASRLSLQRKLLLSLTSTFLLQKLCLICHVIFCCLCGLCPERAFCFTAGSKFSGSAFVKLLPVPPRLLREGKNMTVTRSEAVIGSFVGSKGFLQTALGAVGGTDRSQTIY